MTTGTTFKIMAMGQRPRIECFLCSRRRMRVTTVIRNLLPSVASNHHWGGRLDTLKLRSKVGIWALACILFGLPLVTCAAASATMTSAERECCKKMAERCGDMGMAKSHPCCQATTAPADFHALKTAPSQLHHVREHFVEVGSNSIRPYFFAPARPVCHKGLITRDSAETLQLSLPEFAQSREVAKMPNHHFAGR